MSASSWRALGNFYLSPGYASEYMYGFLAQDLVPDPLAPDADEFLNIIKVSLPDALAMVRRGEIQDSKTLAVLMLAHPLLS